jgi:hypothetical protein
MLSRALHAVVVVVVAAALLGAAGCAECADNFDCGAGLTCSAAGACVGAEQNEVSFVNVDSGDVVDAVFEAVVRLRFRGEVATVSLVATGGDACWPFIPDEQTVFGNDDDFVDVDVPFAGVRAAGERFTLRATLDVNGAVEVVDVDLRAAADDSLGGFAVERGPAGVVDVVDAPWAALAGTSEGDATLLVEPLGGVSSPRLGLGNGVVAGAVPLVRGPQIVWVETTRGEARLRCGFGVRGGPAGDDGGALEFAVLTDAPAWLATSLHLVGDGGGVCDSTRFDAPCRAVARADALVEQNADVIAVDGFDGVIEVAAVPVAFSEPVDAWVRVTRAGRHEALFGPITVFAGEGQSWIAGRVTVENGVVVSVVAVDEFSVGVPW